MYLSATDLSLRQTHILDSNSKKAWWLFEVTYGGSTYYWSNFSSKSYGGNTYTFKIRSFTDIDIGYAGGDFGLIAPSEFYTEIDNAGNSLSPSDLASATLTLRLIMLANLAVQPSGGDATIESGVTLDNSHDDVQEDQMRAWRFNAAHVSPTGLQSLKVKWEPFHLKYLRQDFPTGKLANDEFPDNVATEDNYCIPKTYGTAYIPVRSVYSTDKRYYLLGASGVTYTVSEVRAPRDWSNQTWSSGSYTFTDDTIAGRSGTNYKASRFLIADSDKDGTPDANGIFFQGSKYLDVLAKFSASDTASMSSPGDIIEDFLEALGVPSAEINDTAKASANVIYSGRSITWAGGYWYKQPAEHVLADMLIQCDTDLVVREDLILRPRDNTPKLTVETNLMLVDGSDNDTYRCSPVNQQDYRDSCHVAYRPSGEPMDSLIKIIVPADSATSYPAAHTYNMGLVHDSQVVQKLGTLAAQRKFNRKYEIIFMADPKILQLEVGDVFILAHANYGGPVRVLITGMRISSELDVQIRGTVFSVNLKSWGDLSPGAVTPATDDSTSVYSPIYQGPRNDSDAINQITGDVYIGTGGVLATNSDPATNGGFKATNTELTCYNTNGDIRFQAVYSGTDQGDVIIGNYSGNSGVMWDQSAGTMEVRGTFTTTTGSVKRFELSASDNEAHFYGDRGDTTIEELATIGISSVGGDYVIGNFGSIASGHSNIAIWAGSNSSYAGMFTSVSAAACYFLSTSSNGIYALSTNAAAVYGKSINSHGIYAESQAGSGSYAAVYALGNDAIGIYGLSTSYYGTYGFSTNSYGVCGVSTNSHGGYFQPSLRVDDGSGGYLSITPGTGALKMITDSASMDDEDYFDLPDATTGMLFIQMYTASAGQMGMFQVRADGSVAKAGGTANTAATNTDGNLCVYDAGGTTARVRNRLGGTYTCTYMYFYY